MKSYPLVTIVTATRNRKESLRRLIESVKNQTYPNLEHIVVDGLSSDGTQAMLKEYESKYSIRWISEKDRHQVEAINKGLRMAKGEFITVTHDDDYWLAKGIETIMKVLENHPKADIAYGDSWGEYADGQRVYRRYRAYTVKEMLNEGYQIPQDGAIFRARWLSEVGYLNENLQFVPEYELFLRILCANGKSFYLPEITSVGGLHEEKKSWLGRGRSWDETWAVNRKYGSSFFSKFTLVYIRHRYLSGVVDFIKQKFPRLFHFLKRVLGTPEY